MNNLSGTPLAELTRISTLSVIVQWCPNSLGLQRTQGSFMGSGNRRPSSNLVLTHVQSLWSCWKLHFHFLFLVLGVSLLCVRTHCPLRRPFTKFCPFKEHCTAVDMVATLKKHYPCPSCEEVWPLHALVKPVVPSPQSALMEAELLNALLGNFGLKSWHTRLFDHPRTFGDPGTQTQHKDFVGWEEKILTFTCLLQQQQQGRY